MKLADIKVGDEYAAMPSPTSRRSSAKNARRVKVLEIVETEHTRYTGYYGSKKVKVRKARVQFLDGPLPNGYGYGYEQYSQERDAIIVIEPRKIVAPWGEVEAEHKQAWAHELARIETRQTIEAELEALGIEGASVSSLGPGRFHIRLDQDDWNKLRMKLNG